MSGFTSIDLSRLPAPDVIEAPDFDALLAEMKAEAIRLDPELADALALESEPATKILRVCAYFRMLDRAEFNDGSRANMLAFATGGDLDQLGAYWAVERLVVQEADDTIIPPVELIMEADADFRARIQLSLEGHTSAGPRGSYIYWALSASGDVKDAAVDSPSPGEVVVTVLSRQGDGTPDAALLTAVEEALNDEDIRPLTDQVTVQAASILPYQVDAGLILYDGPDPAAVLATAQAAVDKLVVDLHRLGHDISLSALYAALHIPGVVQRVDLVSPAADIVVGADEAAFCTATPTVTFGGRDV